MVSPLQPSSPPSAVPAELVLPPLALSTIPPELSLSSYCASAPPAPRIAAIPGRRLPSPTPSSLRSPLVRHALARMNSRDRRTASRVLAPQARDDGTRWRSIQTSSIDAEERPHIAPLTLVGPEPQRSLPSFEEGFGRYVNVLPRPSPAPSAYAPHPALDGLRDLARGHVGQERRQEATFDQRPFLVQQIPPQQQNEASSAGREPPVATFDADSGDKSDDSGSSHTFEGGDLMEISPVIEPLAS